MKELYVDQYITNNFDIEFSSPQNQVNQVNQIQSYAAKASYVEGVSKIDVHWWGLKIYMSKTLVNKALFAGVTLGGIWIPSKVIASIGVAFGLTDVYPGGIWFDQYWIAAIGPVKTVFGFDAYGWQ
ncbi:hypothetical protein ABFY60_01275 [Lysinibacillus pakistanensis]|uniref:hypothetical protein n=1 Tax=Lysinibacillus pakistanensis TaxID=759811 RepID=UPI003D2BB55D